jgi:hypothetical protein
MRKTLGQVCYPKAEQVFEDPAKEASRREQLMKWRRKQLGLLVVSHVRRVVREDGLARSIEELHDRQGRPPPNINVDRMMRQYRKLKRQHGWLSAIVDTCRATLREIDLVRFIKETAEVERKLMARKTAREAIMIAVAEKEQGGTQLPPKLGALIRQVVKRDIGRKEFRNVLLPRPEAHSMLMSYRIQEVMRYMFVDEMPDHVRETMDYNPETRYRFLFDAYCELTLLIEDLEANIYQLQEYVESADLVLMRYE